MDRFYAELTPFQKFTDFTDIAAYTPVPNQWLVLCADVRGSTKAIEAGRYKDVNMIGAACITAVLNVSGNTELPFVFGGDGATVVIPPSLQYVAVRELLALQEMARSRFELDLRVGVIPVADLRARKAEVRVRKYQLSPGNFLAMFAGGGIELAETLLKAPDPDNKYLLAPQQQSGPPKLEGLSCRWEPLQPKGGLMLTMIVRGTSTEAAGERALMGETLSMISEILGTDPQNANPASPQSMKFRWPPRGARLEAVLTTGSASFAVTYLKVLITSLIQIWCDSFGKKAGDYDGRTYTDELRSNTDYRKYDDTLRMVLDLSTAQAERIERYLQKRFEDGDLIYGTHRAKSALMTCVVFSLEQSEHIHFVDGADGGFAVAAIDFKQRLAAWEKMN